MMLKASNSTADIIRLELEDGVVRDRKPIARETCVKAMQEIDWKGKEVWVRIASFPEGFAEDDVKALVVGRPNVILMGKTQTPEDMHRLADLVREAEKAAGLPEGEIRIGAGIESARAVSKIEDIAAAPRMSMMCLGLDDMSIEYGYRLSREPADAIETLYIRSRMVLAARLAGITCIDYPYLKFKDEAGSEIDARFSARLGFDGKSVISPRQLAGVHRAFAPSDKELAWARSILSAEQSNDSTRPVFVANGAMADAPHVKQAAKLLKRAELAGAA